MPTRYKILHYSRASIYPPPPQSRLSSVSVRMIEPSRKFYRFIGDFDHLTVISMEYLPDRSGCSGGMTRHNLGTLRLCTKESTETYNLSMTTHDRSRVFFVEEDGVEISACGDAVFLDVI